MQSTLNGGGDKRDLSQGLKAPLGGGLLRPLRAQTCGEQVEAG